jgi:hypothetical protein
MPALPGIIAKVLVLVEKVLDCFVTVHIAGVSGNWTNMACCNYFVWNGTTTDCGNLLVTNVTQVTMQIMELVNQIIGALMVEIY